MKLVSATCSENFSSGVALFEPLESGLPVGLLASPALVQVSRGTVYVPVVNVGTNDALFYPRRVKKSRVRLGLFFQSIRLSFLLVREFISHDIPLLDDTPV